MALKQMVCVFSRLRIAWLSPRTREFRDVVFEDAGFDNNSYTDNNTEEPFIDSQTLKAWGHHTKS